MRVIEPETECGAGQLGGLAAHSLRLASCFARSLQLGALAGRQLRARRRERLPSGRAQTKGGPNCKRERDRDGD